MLSTSAYWLNTLLHLLFGVGGFRVSNPFAFLILAMIVLPTSTFADNGSPIFADSQLRGLKEDVITSSEFETKKSNDGSVFKPSQETVGSVNKVKKSHKKRSKEHHVNTISSNSVDQNQDLSTIELRGVLSEAIANSDSVKIAAKQVHIADTKIWREIAKFTPTLKLSLDTSVSSLGSGGLSSADKTSEMNFALSMPLFTSGQRVFSLLAARNNKMAAQNDAISARNKVIEQTISAYLQYHQTKQTVGLLGQNVASLQKLLNAVRDRKHYGVASQADVAYVQSNLLSMKQQHQSAKLSQSQLQAQLESITGRSLAVMPKLSDIDHLILDDEEALVQTAIVNNPAIKSANYSANAQRHTSRAAYGKYLPQVNLYGQHDVGLNSYTKSQQATDWKVGVKLTMPLVDLGTVTEIAESRQQAQLASYQASDTRRNIELSVRSLSREYQSGKGQIKLANSRVDYVRQIANSERQRYEKGVGSLDQLLEQNRTLAQARIDAIGVKTNAYWSGYQLLVAVGGFDGRQWGL